MADAVVLADESPTLRALARLALAQAPWTLVLADSGDAAVASVRAHRPRVVLADALLPGLDGYELCRRVRALVPEVWFVLMCADYVPYDATLGAAVGVSRTLRKPFDRSALLAALGEAPPAASPSGPNGGAFERTLAGAPPGLTSGPPRAATAGAAEIADRLPALVAEELPRALAALLKDPDFAAVVARAVTAAVTAEREHILSELREAVTPVIWKTVPSLAEQLIKEEIARLTEEVAE